MKLAYAIAAVFFARLLVSAWFEPGRDADLIWQSWLGTHILATHRLPHAIGSETFSAPGAPWVPQEWAFSVAVAWANAHARFWWIAVLSALSAALTLILTGYRARCRGASTVVIGITVACAGFAMLQSFGARAQVFGWLCLALLMLLLDLENAWLFAAIPVVALWANLHASAAIAPVLVGCWTLGTWIEDRAWTPRVARNALVAAGCVLALFATPLLWELPRYALTLMNSSFRGVVREWQPSTFADPALTAGVLPLLAICCYFGIAAPRERWRDGMLLAMTAPLAFMAVRHLPICALTIAPMAAQRLTSAIGPYSRVNVVLEERFTQFVLGAAAAIGSFMIAVNLLHAPAAVGGTLPFTAVARLAALPGKHDLFCEDFAWCSLALKTHNVREYIDGRCDPFPKRAWRNYIGIEQVHPDWRRRLRRTGSNAVLVRRGHALAQALSRQHGWRVFYGDATYELFLRDGVQTAKR